MQHNFPAGLLSEAKEHPNGWVYEIDSRFDPMGEVPFKAIIRAWKISGTGQPTGEVWENPDYESAVE
jgi:hypothetical protein